MSPTDTRLHTLDRLRHVVCRHLDQSTWTASDPILKPTLEHTLGMTEVGYGYIVDAFRSAYAIGLR